MENGCNVFILIAFIAFAGELLDSSIGMGYGTFLAPILIILGFEPLIIVPAILLSQALGGSIASLFHHRLKNACFRKDSSDTKILLVVSGLGVGAAIFASIIAITLPKTVLTTYIGILAIIMGLIMLRKKQFVLSWKKVFFFSALSAFNKGISGGGFGPIMTGGQVIAGQRHKAAVGITTLAEVPICIASFVTYTIGMSAIRKGIPSHYLSLDTFKTIFYNSAMLEHRLIVSLVIGVSLAAPLGAMITKKSSVKKLQNVMATAILLFGGWIIVKLLV